MEGKYVIRTLNDPYDKHEHVEFIFDDNTCLRYKDTRKFGRMHLLNKDELYLRKPLNELGKEPWDETLNVEFQLSYKDLGFYDENGKYLVEKGSFEIYVGENCLTLQKLLIKVV